MSRDDGGVDGEWRKCKKCGRKADYTGSDSKSCPWCGGATEPTTASRVGEA